MLMKKIENRNVFHSLTPRGGDGVQRGKVILYSFSFKMVYYECYYLLNAIILLDLRIIHCSAGT